MKFSAGHLKLTPANRWLEPLLALSVIAAIIRAFFYFREFAHFPQPFFYEPFDVWMDWFNTSYWAYNKGAYDAWGTVYPPLSFVFLRIFSLSSCYKETNGYSIRECDWVGLVTLHFIFFANIVLLYLSFRKFDRKSALWRAIGLGLGLPSLYGLERGNLIVVCFTCIILGLGPLLKSARLRWIAVGMAINFKVYVIAGLFPHLLRRRWLWFEGAMISTLVIYLVSYGLMGAGTPKQIFNNIADFSVLYQAATFLDLWYAATFRPLLSLLTGQTALVAGLIGSRNVETLVIVLNVMMYGVMLSIVVAAIAAWLRPEVVPVYRLTFLGFAFATLAAEPGGYTEGFLIFFLFLEPWKGFARKWSIFASYILCMPFDIIIDRVPPTVQESYLAGHATFFAYYITIGPFVRPLLILTMVLAMALLTIRQVWVDIRLQGWRGRWRYRLDRPMLPGVAQPVKDAAR